MRAFSAAFFRENDTENGHKEELTYEENKTWISCFGNDLLTLVTCEYSARNGRMVVVAKKIE